MSRTSTLPHDAANPPSTTPSTSSSRSTETTLTAHPPSTGQLALFMSHTASEGGMSHCERHRSTSWPQFWTRTTTTSSRTS